MREVHRTRVPSRAVDPAARTAKRAYNALNSASVGLELGLSVAIGLLVGVYMDKWLGTEPWLMLLWLTFGVIAGFRGVFRAVARADRAAEAEAQYEPQDAASAAAAGTTSASMTGAGGDRGRS